MGAQIWCRAPVRQTRGMAETARHPAFWKAVETIHDVVYFAEDAKARYGELGLKGYWRGYFASRAGALGTPGAEVVTASFHGFAPSMVERAIPDVWTLADRDAVLAERVAIARDALQPALEQAGQDVEALADSLSIAVRDLDMAGKPLAAAHRAQPVPNDPVGRLWHGATVFREYRGDSHVAVLTAAGLGGCAANALQVATGRAAAAQQGFRGWTDEQWAAANESLREWGWVGDDGTATDLGRSARDRLEDATDRACDAGIGLTTRARMVTLAEPLLTIAQAVAESGAVPFPNPTGGSKP